MTEEVELRDSLSAWCKTCNYDKDGMSCESPISCHAYMAKPSSYRVKVKTWEDLVGEAIKILSANPLGSVSDMQVSVAFDLLKKALDKSR